MFQAFGQLASQLSTQQRGFVANPNTYDTYAACSVGSWVNIPGMYGEMYTPSGVALLGAHVFVYPLGGPVGAYFYPLIDGVSTAGAFMYFNGAGWVDVLTFIHVFTGLDKQKKHTFQMQGQTSANTANYYNSYQPAGYQATFWGMDFPARMFGGPPASNIPL